MSTEPVTMNWRNYAGRFSVEFEVTNYEDVVQARKGFLPAEQVRRARITGIVDTGATRLVLPASVVTALGVRETGQVSVRLADGRRETKTVVGDVQLEIQRVHTVICQHGFGHWRDARRGCRRTWRRTLLTARCSRHRPTATLGPSSPNVPQQVPLALAIASASFPE